MNTNFVRKNITHLPAAAVFFAAAWQSFGHTVHVASAYGQGDSAWLMPISIDGLMVVASKYVTHAKTKAGKMAAIAVFGLAASTMLAMNYLAAQPGFVAHFVGIVPAAAMILAGALIHWAPQAKTPVRRRPAAKKPTTNVRPIRSASKKTA